MVVANVVGRKHGVRFLARATTTTNTPCDKSTDDCNGYDTGSCTNACDGASGQTAAVAVVIVVVICFCRFLRRGRGSRRSTSAGNRGNRSRWAALLAIGDSVKVLRADSQRRIRVETSPGHGLVNRPHLIASLLTEALCRIDDKITSV